MIREIIIDLIAQLPTENLPTLIDSLNQIRAALHEISPFKSEPVDFVKWVPVDKVYANDYNPNEVAPPEMELLRVSIQADGYTQPIVTMPTEGKHEVVDGFHRHRVGRELPDVNARIHGYLPLVMINQDRYDKADRMAATIRHNRARGKHKVDSMSDIVIELKRRNWSDDKIAKNLGMEPDEVLRLCQITELAELQSIKNFQNHGMLMISKKTSFLLQKPANLSALNRDVSCILGKNGNAIRPVSITFILQRNDKRDL